MARWLWAISMGAVLSAAATNHTSAPNASAAGVVSSCTESALDAAIAGGGIVTFTCNGTITLTATKVIGPGMTLVIDGSGRAITFNGGDSVQLFRVRPGGSLALMNLALVGGRASTFPGLGGAISNGGTLAVSDTTFRENSAPGGVGVGGGVGGAIWNAAGGALTVTRTTFVGNSAAGGGAGIGSEALASTTVMESTFDANSGGSGSGIHNFGGALVVDRSVFTDNVTVGSPGVNPGPGGAIRNTGTAVITRSTFASNTAAVVGGGAIVNEGSLSIAQGTFHGNTVLSGLTSFGGGGAILNYGDLGVHNSTFNGNSVPLESEGGIFGTGGAIQNRGALILVHSTVSGNEAFGGSGAFNSAEGTMTVANTLLVHNSSGTDCASTGTLIDGAGNVTSDGSCGLPKATVELGPLAENGGPTRTMAIARDGAAFNTGVRATCDAPLPNGGGAVDQRGFPRVTCSAGAYEPLPILAFRRFVPSAARD